jgi:anion transporter
MSRPAVLSPLYRLAIWGGLALALFLAARLLPTLPGLNARSQAVLGVVLAGAILWMSEAVPLGLTAVVVLALLGLTPYSPPSTAFAGFASPTVFFLFGALALGQAVERTGLAARAARLLLRGARGSSGRLYWQMLLGFPPLAFLIPSAITRNALLVPAYETSLREMGQRQGSRAARATMQALGVLNPLASTAFLTGGTTAMATATLIGGFTWFRWFALLAVPYYLLLFGGGFLLWTILGRDSATQPAPAPDPAPAPSLDDAPGPLSSAERRTLAVLGLTAALWLSDAWHHLSPAIPALIGASLLLAPGIGVLSWKEFESRVSWSMLLTVGASLSLAAAMTESGAAAWLGRGVVGVLAVVGQQPLVVVGTLILLTAAVHLAITNLAACVALLVPIAVGIGANAGVNPIVCALAVMITIDAVILYPVQTASNLIAYEAGAFDATDVRRLGLAMLLLVLLVVLGIAVPYWGMVGLTLR